MSKSSHPTTISFARAGHEPSLQDMLSDPVVHAVMRRDSLTTHDILTVMENARRSLRSGECTFFCAA